MRRPFLLILALVLVLPMQAQLGQKGRYTLSGGLRIGMPLGEFDAAYGRTIGGFGLNLAVPLKGLPLATGFQYDRSYLGGRQGVVAVDEQYVTVTSGDLRVRSRMNGYHALARLAPLKGKVSPYLDGLIGLRSFTTNSQLTVDGVNGPLREDNILRGTAFSYGWAAGVLVGITPLLYVEGRFERFKGGRARYVEPTSITIDSDGHIDYVARESGTDLLTIHLGVGLRF
ncbi:MAG: hypothetical protein H6597_02495 [Flavobacteriales bacterium]|nr:hypothetical protein [Flavobacteriales bacterium]MCB9193376.1 hypothetical protein [Flavobacteriales bacterium]